MGRIQPRVSRVFGIGSRCEASEDDLAGLTQKLVFSICDSAKDDVPKKVSLETEIWGAAENGQKCAVGVRCEEKARRDFQ